MTVCWRTRKSLPIFALLIGLVYLALTTSLVLTRAPQTDEAWFASPAVNLLRHGFMGTTIVEARGALGRGVLTLDPAV